MELPELDPDQRRVLERVRTICLALPEAIEEVKWGHPTWTVAKKIFAGFGLNDGALTLSTKQTVERQTELIDTSDRYFISPYVGRHGWTSMRLDGRVAWSAVEELVRTSYTHVAPKAKPKTKSKSTPAPRSRSTKKSATSTRSKRP